MKFTKQIDLCILINVTCDFVFDKPNRLICVILIKMKEILKEKYILISEEYSVIFQCILAFMNLYQNKHDFLEQSKVINNNKTDKVKE